MNQNFVSIILQCILVLIFSFQLSWIAKQTFFKLNGAVAFHVVKQHIGDSETLFHVFFRTQFFSEKRGFLETGSLLTNMPFQKWNNRPTPVQSG